MSFGPNPWQQQHWDWRAACNFMFGGAGAGLIAGGCAFAPGARVPLVLGAGLVMVGLLAVWLEIGRPKRALNVFRHSHRSWMTREAMVAPLLLGATFGAFIGWPPAIVAAPLFALAFAYCQGRILRAAKGIPAWREPRIVPLIVATGFAEGAGAWLLLNAPVAAVGKLPWLVFALLLVARGLLWFAWRRRLRAAAPALAAIDAAGRGYKLATALALLAALFALGAPGGDEGVLRALQAAAGLLALAGGLWFKYTLITRGAFNQGFALVHLPVRGAPRQPEN